MKALELMETTAYPGGREEQSGTYDVQDVGEDDEQVQQEPSTKRRKLHNPWLAAEEVSQQFVMRLLRVPRILYSRD